MATKYTKEEIKAMNEKINNPNLAVVCPRCGKELHFRDYQSACEVQCETDGCLRGVIRGI